MLFEQTTSFDPKKKKNKIASGFQAENAGCVNPGGRACNSVIIWNMEERENGEVKVDNESKFNFCEKNL